uniref:Guanylate cyclase domain-containing protein n=1 Tax=Terrapene triunguis TaxID=2587831 RepID=A0A674JHM5_9SAUR
MPKWFLCRSIVCKALWDESSYIMKMALYSVSFINFLCSSDVLCFGGDILNFTGTYYILSDIITLAAKCSLEMQEQFGFSYTKEGLELRLKIGLSAGHVSQLIVGDEMRQYLLVTGQQVDNVRLAQSLAQAREVILSPNCWELCDRNVLEAEMLKGQKAMKVGIFHPLDFDEHFEKCIDHLQHYPNDEGEILAFIFSLMFLIFQIDDNQPLAFVSELRLVTVVSVKLQFHESTKVTELCKLVQDATVSISGIMEGWRGKIIQISTYGKVSKAGLSRSVRCNPAGEEESTHALDSAMSISNFCSKNLMKIELVSIGITSGLAFCGVAGMRSRQEYTVTGSKVKMASRMLTLYPGMISCDEEIYSISGLPGCFFKKLPEKETSDAVSSGVTYEYLGRKRNSKKDGNRPLLGRWIYPLGTVLIMCRVVMYEGSTGYGKSRLIAEIDYLAREENHRVIALELSKVDIQEIDACRPYKRQDIFQSKLTGLWDETFYCLLNNQFLVKVSHMDNETKQKEEEMLFLRVLWKVTEEATLIFIIDEAQYIDAASWDFLAKLLSSVPVFIVLSLSPFASKELLPCASAQGITKSPKTAGVVLQELEPSKLLEMARQALGVVSIPREMETFLIQRSSGVPLYCDIAVAQLDSLSPSEQMAVKCAAVIGHTFTPELLLYILPEWTNKKMEETLMSLINSHVFECFGKEARATQAVGSCHLQTHLDPLTMQTLGPEESEGEQGSTAIIITLALLYYYLFIPLPRCVKHFYKQVKNDRSMPRRTASLSGFQSDKSDRYSTWATAGLPSLLSHHRVEQEFLDRVDKMIKCHKRGREEATNLAPCECGERVESVVSALARHCLMVKDRTRAFYCLLESAAASLYLANNYMAYLYLKKASGLQELSALAVFPCLKRPKMKINQFEEATFCSLRGEVCFNMGQIALAKKLIKRTLCLLHKGFPRTWLGAFFQSFLEESKHSAYHTQKALAVLQQQIHCLSLLWQLYSLDPTANRKYSWLAALMNINVVDASENKMQIISTYMDFSQFSQSMGYKDEWLKYEMMAIQRSSQCNFTFTRERLQMTAQLAQLGESILTVCWEGDLQCLVLSVLFKSVFLKNKYYHHFILVLEWLWELATQEESVIVLACFYSACLDLLLWFDYRPIEECLQFINQYESSCILKSQSNILLSLYSSLAIWFGRLHQWNLFEESFTKAQRLVSRTNASLFGTHGFFRFLECQGLLLWRVMEDTPEKVRETRSSTLGVIFLLCQFQCLCKGRTGNNQAWSEQVLCMHSSSHLDLLHAVLFQSWCPLYLDPHVALPMHTAPSGSPAHVPI